METHCLGTSFVVSKSLRKIPWATLEAFEVSGTRCERRRYARAKRPVRFTRGAGGSAASWRGEVLGNPAIPRPLCSERGRLLPPCRALLRRVFWDFEGSGVMQRLVPWKRDSQGLFLAACGTSVKPQIPLCWTGNYVKNVFTAQLAGMSQLL